VKQLQEITHINNNGLESTHFLNFVDDDTHEVEDWLLLFKIEI
jgi:hypothetical protein